jgi:hypothetical protein|tara:strand:+ start:442 stop:747 length:306 start_codon:yes stop_codon:yes gene_type:complete
MCKGLEKIYERNKDTGAIRSREPMDYGNETTHPTQEEIIEFNKTQAEKMHHEIQYRVRREVLDELWAAPKVNHQGQWYVRLTDVVKIIGDDNNLYENESQS